MIDGTALGRQGEREPPPVFILLTKVFFELWRKMRSQRGQKCFAGSRSLQVLDIRLELENRDLKPANTHFPP
ncbi:hypothetical protein LSTR_LSTR015666 [Laodelphax striatellus]|uniref:Uncharacterized protein n=1 Tax=Laodelphax striatellus TaxID=195883 RepID=A0A482XP08_LAOST|nr:hypothetical protein LSTR_LSTR015666 [Laodelphax striatellus]